MNQRVRRHVSLLSYIPGPSDVMADDACRRFGESDDQLL
jgi:hypothetical protein